MATLTIRGRDEILMRAVARLVARTRFNDLNEASVQLHTLAWTSREIEDIHVQIFNLLSMFDPYKMTTAQLDEFAQIFVPLGLAPRRGATRAQQTVNLATVGAVAIPVAVGTLTGAGAILFRSTVAGTVPAFPGVGSIAFEAVVTGAASNVAAHAIDHLVTALPGVDTVDNPTAGVLGEDAESNAEFLGRILAFQRSLCRGTPFALESLARTVGVTAPVAPDPYGTPIKVYEDDTPTIRRCRYATLVEDDAHPCVSTLWIDDGLGFAGAGALTATHLDVVLIDPATGGERRFRTPRWPIELGAVFDLQRNPGGGYASLVEGVDYTINRSNGRVTLATALIAGDKLRIHAYTISLDLVRAVQYAVEGDRSTPALAKIWPGWRAAGTTIYVRRPTIRPVDVSYALVLSSSLDTPTSQLAAYAAAHTAMSLYLDSLSLGQNVIFDELVAACMAVDGVEDVIFYTPTGNVAIPDNQLARAGTITP